MIGRKRQATADGFDLVAAYQHKDGSLLVPIGSPPSWEVRYFYVVNNREEISQPFEPLRCLRLAEGEVRRSTRKITVDCGPNLSINVAVGYAVDTPSGYVIPWEIRIGADTVASLHPPPWVVFASEVGEGSVSYAVERVRPDALHGEREVRLRQVERAMRSAKLLDHIRQITGRRMIVQWFEGHDVWGESTFESGRELFDALIDRSTRNRAHLIHFPDGWYVDGMPWLA